MHPGKLHDMVKPLCWLIGTWRSVSARVSYPTMKCPVDFEETLTFISAGQPLLNYSSVTWNPKDKSPMHLEAGYLRIDEDGCSIALLTAQNFGISTVEEGMVEGNMMETTTKVIGSTKFAKNQVVALHRCYSLNEKGQLIYKLSLQTPKTPLTPHLDCLYDKDQAT